MTAARFPGRAGWRRLPALGAGAVVLAFAWAAASQTTPSAACRRGAEMPTARSEIAAAALDGRVYVAGGLTLREAETEPNP